MAPICYPPDLYALRPPALQNPNTTRFFKVFKIFPGGYTTKDNLLWNKFQNNKVKSMSTKN